MKITYSAKDAATCVVPVHTVEPLSLDELTELSAEIYRTNERLMDQMMGSLTIFGSHGVIIHQGNFGVEARYISLHELLPVPPAREYRSQPLRPLKDWQSDVEKLLGEVEEED